MYANLIDTYTSPDELEDKILSLKNLGYCPYVIKDRDGKSRLFVGTFVTKEPLLHIPHKIDNPRIWLKTELVAWNLVYNAVA